MTVFKQDKTNCTQMYLVVTVDLLPRSSTQGSANQPLIKLCKTLIMAPAFESGVMEPENK